MPLGAILLNSVSGSWIVPTKSFYFWTFFLSPVGRYLRFSAVKAGLKHMKTKVPISLPIQRPAPRLLCQILLQFGVMFRLTHHKLKVSYTDNGFNQPNYSFTTHYTVECLSFPPCDLMVAWELGSLQLPSLFTAYFTGGKKNSKFQTLMNVYHFLMNVYHFHTIIEAKIVKQTIEVIDYP